MDNIKTLVEIRRKFREETKQKVGDINGSTYTIEYTQWLQNELVKKLTIPVVVSTLPSIVEINFDGNLKCQIETTDKSLTVLKAVNGYGNAVDCNKDKTIITEI